MPVPQSPCPALFQSPMSGEAVRGGEAPGAEATHAGVSVPYERGGRAREVCLLGLSLVIVVSVPYERGGRAREFITSQLNKARLFQSPMSGEAVRGISETGRSGRIARFSPL